MWLCAPAALRCATTQPISRQHISVDGLLGAFSPTERPVNARESPSRRQPSELPARGRPVFGRTSLAATRR